ncbi:hypothetical protein PG993_007075 [Apiospora rasikravindrae]|uniref:Uncharacterized protein n=1 Tax=Apiospora rasikravindrae TaxID=990691 RepID=A0ABR1SWG5_9PEZI
MATQAVSEAPEPSSLASSVSHLPSTSSRPGHSSHDSDVSDNNDSQPAPPGLPSRNTTSNPIKTNSTNNVMRWRPFYLRRTVLLGFLAVFLGILIAIEILFFVSKKNNGIATCDPHKHYLWTYGPTAFLTILAATWSRVEYQSKLMVPWIRLSQPGNAVSQTLLRDYISQFSPFALFTSLHHRDFLVSITVAVGFTMKLVIVISTGLIILTPIGIEATYPMVIQNSFVDSASRFNRTTPAVANAEPISSYLMMGHTAGGIPLPDGIFGGYAFQSVQTNMPAGVDTRVTVDGLTNSLDCEPAEVKLKEARLVHGDSSDIAVLLNMSINSPGCNVSSFMMHSIPLNQTRSEHFFARLLSPVQCDGIPGETGRRAFVIVGLLTYYSDYSPTERNVDTKEPKHQLGVELTNSTQLMCVPEYAINRVEVVQNRTNTKSVMLVQGSAKRTLESVNAWQILDAQSSSEGRLYGTKAPPFIFALNGTSDSPAGVDAEINEEAVWLVMNHKLDSVSAIKYLYNPKVLQQVTSEIYQQLSAITCKYSLMQPTSMNTTGSAIMSQERLVVQIWAAQWVSGLAIICITLIAISLFLVPSQGILPSSPSTIMGMASIIINSERLITTLRYAGLADDEYLCHYLEPSAFQSEHIHNNGANQSEYLIHVNKGVRSEKLGRLGHANSRLSHPVLLHPGGRSALCIGLVAVIITLEVLLQQSSNNSGIGGAGNEIYLHYTWTAIPALILGLLAMAFSATDFVTRSLVPYMLSKENIRRKRLSHLALLDAPEVSSGRTSGYLASWIFTSNLTYPRFTYGDLAFPELLVGAPTSPQDLFNTSTASIAAVIPAALGPPATDIYYHNPLGLWIEGEGCNRDPQSEQFRYNRVLSTSTEATYFGLGGIETADTVNGCSRMLYAWGHIDYNADPILQHVAALGCNVSYEIVDVATTFVGMTLDLDPQNPPQPRENTARNSTIHSFSLPVYVNLAQVNYAPQLLDNFFSLLVSSPWAISMSDLGDKSAVHRVADAIKFHHGVIMAQSLAESLLPANKTNTTLGASTQSGQTDADLVYNATMSGRSKRRVVQDATATRILEALAGASLVLFLVGWIKLPRTDVLPRDTVTSIASVVALIAGGNLLSHLPPDAQQLGSEAEIIAALRGGPGLRLWMGWGLVPDVQGKMYGNENEAGESRFGIFVVNDEEEEGVGEGEDTDD